MVYCLVGPSGSGKTTVAYALKDQYNVIQSYTTRPRRQNETWGHIFVDHYPGGNNVIAHNNYNGYHYWATKEQVVGKTIYVIDPPGDAMLRKTMPATTIFLRIGEHVARERMAERPDAEKRISYDRWAFAAVKTDYVVNAERSLREVLCDIESIIGEM